MENVCTALFFCNFNLLKIKNAVFTKYP